MGAGRGHTGLFLSSSACCRAPTLALSHSYLWKGLCWLLGYTQEGCGRT